MSVVTFPLPDNRSGKAAPAPEGPTPDEGLRLISAFMKIQDSEMRTQLIRLAERFADLSP